ncbi:MAG: carbohydrate-binding family 9-like protein [Saprospiraceae bacterium]|nr:carbohydrate-binding family 9-like protein [Saprospiraceae bacterium]
MKLITICLSLIFPALLGSDILHQSEPMYDVTKLDAPITIDANWDKPVWQNIPALTIKNFMGDKPQHFPFVQSKIAYDDQAIYVIFRVEDQYVKSVAKKNQDGVFKDSCVEFFFSPDDNSQDGYFNLEMNCSGKMLFHHQMKPRTDSKHISPEDIAQIEVAHSLPDMVDPEITEPTTWTVEYRIPFEILKKYHHYESPKTGTIWKANLYKCADDTSHPHWLTWSPVDFPRPNFHIPEFFGTLRFD